MVSSKITLTPPLKPAPDSKIATFTEAGKWDQRDLSELDKLAESLNVDIIAPAWLDLSGIPDMWARPIMFEIALFDENHVLFNRTVGEWRGMLALLALREVSGFAVTVKQLDIEPNNKFLKALHKMAPTRALFNGTSWKKLFILYYDGKPIGITNPMTLVCTSASFVNLGKITWVDDLRLANPVPKLNDQKKRQLVAWLLRLNEGIRAHYGQENVQRANNLLRRIQEFVSDLAVDSCPIADGINDLQLPGFFQNMGRAVARAKQVDTHLAIVGSKVPPTKPIIIVEADIAQQWGVSPHDLIIYNGITLDNMPLGGIRDETIIGSLPLTTHRAWESKKLFTEKLHLITSRNALPLAYVPEGGDSIDIDGDICTPILPIATDLIEYFQPEELSSRLTFHQDGDFVIVALRIPLSGINGAPREYRATRRYSRSGGEIALIPNVPLLSIWPNFLAPNWNLYYSLCWSESESAFSAEPVTEADVSEENYRKIRGGQVIQLDKFPEVYSCSFRGDKKAGLIFVQKPDNAPHAASDKWRIGVDFGTTGTNVYYTSSHTGDKPLFPTLRRRHLLITDTNESEQLNLIFLPKDEQSKTFLSVFRDVNRNTQDSYKPLLDGHIFYLNTPDFLQKFEANRSQPGDLRDDLKWGGESDKRVHKLVKTFLKQLCIQTMAEAAYEGADEVNWRFSYPSSFSYDHMNNFGNAWDQIAEECHRETGLGGGHVGREPESVSAAKYFHSTSEIEGTFASGAICLDIGGGTTDVSIWAGRTLVWQTSLRFAGRHIFTELLQANGNLRDVLGLSKTWSDRYARISTETNIRQGAEKALKRLNEVFMEPEVKQMQRNICLSLSAIFYYIGLATKGLISDGKLNISDCPNIYVAGGGSQLFHWAAGGKFDEGHQIAKLFKYMYAEAAGMKVSTSSFRTFISPQPKDEAAIGLVSNSPLTYEPDVLKAKYLAGEGFRINGSDIPWNTQIDASTFSGASIKRVEPKVFIMFLEAFNSKCTEFGIVPLDYRGSMTQIGMKVDEIFSNYTTVSEENLLIEPVFMSYVKVFIRSLGKF